MKKTTKHVYKRARVRLDALKVDHRYQGPLQKKRVEKLLKEWDDDLGYTDIYVSLRSNGTYWIIDGQHRVATMMDAGMGAYEIEVNLFEGLSLQEEARLHKRLNEVRSRTLYEKFNSAVVGKMHPEYDINKVVEDSGWKISRSRGPGCINAIAAARWIFLQYGADALALVLRTVERSWQRDDGSVEAPILLGIARFYANNSVRIDDLVPKLQSSCSPVRLVTRIKERKAIDGESIAEAGEQVVLSIYRKHKRSAPKLVA
jgi:Family of unknown function (DUF6551)